jgi:hypothetical protein
MAFWYDPPRQRWPQSRHNYDYGEEYGFPDLYPDLQWPPGSEPPPVPLPRVPAAAVSSPSYVPGESSWHPGKWLTTPYGPPPRRETVAEWAGLLATPPQVEGTYTGPMPAIAYVPGRGGENWWAYAGTNVIAVNQDLTAPGSIPVAALQHELGHFQWRKEHPGTLNDSRQQEVYAEAFTGHPLPGWYYFQGYYNWLPKRELMPAIMPSWYRDPLRQRLEYGQELRQFRADPSVKIDYPATAMEAVAAARAAERAAAIEAHAKWWAAQAQPFYRPYWGRYQWHPPELTPEQWTDQYVVRHPLEAPPGFPRPSRLEY